MGAQRSHQDVIFIANQIGASHAGVGAVHRLAGDVAVGAMQGVGRSRAPKFDGMTLAPQGRAAAP